MLIATEPTVQPASGTEWDGLVRQFPDYTVYHTLPWLRTVSDTHGVTPRMMKASVDGECVAVWPFWETRKGPLRVIGSPLPGWSTAYLGPLFSVDADVPAILHAFMNDRAFRSAYFACKVLTRLRDVDLEPFGFTKLLAMETFCIDLTQPIETIWSNFKSECRTRIRKAEKLGVEVLVERDPAFLDDYWKMSVETFQKSNIQPTHSEHFVHVLWKHMYPAGAVHALSAVHQGQRIASLLMLKDEHTMYYWGGAAYSASRDVPSHNLLHWTAMQHAREMGLREYDFISTFGGPGRFKKTFGPAVVPIATHWERSQSRLIAALKRGYESYLLAKRRLKP